MKVRATITIVVEDEVEKVQEILESLGDGSDMPVVIVENMIGKEEQEIYRENNSILRAKVEVV